VTEEKLLAGDALEVAFTLAHNDHPEFGGIELSLRDFRVPVSRQAGENAGSPSTEAKAQPAARS